ncbi:LADA_0D08416g1_1 [Lachancea dasiensis]|uniref:LADA_0D08416g1_1 n=1 Tax=Lachancea dasiensis TaxID=1072105 RepID=A0A1G4J6X7_9SACH|nr:LADA_0D08416g1_1 [Lachancea dasiensis]
MSGQQVCRCVCDVLGLELNDPANDWTQGRLKKLQNTTSTLYNVSLNKVMLKQHEEVARMHLCAFLAAEKLSEKYEPDLRYGSDKIPLEPRKILKMLEIMRTSILSASPVKRLSWSPSSKTVRQSPVKNGGRFTAIDPNEMRRQLFGTPTKSAAGQKRSREATSEEDLLETPKQTKTPGTPGRDNHVGSPTRATRRKLVFEMDDDTVHHGARKSENIGDDDDGSVQAEEDKEEPQDEEEERSSSRPSPRKALSSPKRRFNAPDVDPSGASISQRSCLLYKKYYKVTPAEVIELCNHFEIPRDVAYRILDQFFEHATYLVFPYQLVCGLILNCAQVIFNEQRRKDPRVTEYLYQKMCMLMRTNELTDIKECMQIVRELIDGEKWFRTLKVDHDYYDGVAYEEAIAIRLGNMLQRPTNVASDEQFEIWKHRLMTDISLRDG